MVLSTDRDSVTANAMNGRTWDVEGPVESHESDWRSHADHCIAKLPTVLTKVVISRHIRKQSESLSQI